MTDPRSPSDDDLVLAAFDGNAENDARAPLSPSLQAEIDGLRAVRALLNDDAAWGEQSGADVPPPHLLDAIVRAEVAARSDVVRQAVANASTPTAAPSAWQRLSSWLVGGGVLVGAAAAVLLTVQRAPDLQAEATAAPKLAPAAIAPAEAPAPPPPPPPPPPPAPMASATAQAPTDGVAPIEGAADAARADAAGVIEAERAVAASRGAVAKDEAVPAALGQAALGQNEAAKGARSGDAPDADKKPSPAKAAKKADASMFDAEDDAFGGLAKPAPPAAAPAAPASAAAPPPPAEPAVNGNEVRRLFRERIAEEKAEARKEAKEGKAKASAEGMVRDRQVQEANSTLLTAERELSQGRFAVALDLALRAEAMSGGALGLAPVATQARALRGLGRHADAARLGNRLLSGNAADPQLMAGVVAAAASALDVGDRVLCRRLSQVALQKGNDDERLRTEARRLLKLVAQPQASEAAADAATSAPAKP